MANIFKTGNATEHSYRPALQKLFNSLDPKVTALNEPRRVKVGAPDFSISRGDIVIGHCEAKDLSVDLKVMKDANLAQKKRYLGGLQNLIYTNCLEWQWYRDGELKHEVRIADLLMGVQPTPDRFPALEALLREFIDQTPQTITSSRALAERMAGKAALIKDVLANSLLQDKDGTSELMDQYNAFKVHLIHDISIADFSDIYAETITYGMFAARLHDKGLDTFDRQEALELLPRSNPFLRNLFSYIAGPNLDPRIAWIIDDLARLFRASNVWALMEKYGKTTQRNDPFLHFYEDFLKAYNPEKRDARGVWYTPEPVVNFIVRAVDDVLKTEFKLADGLADTSKVTIPWDTGQKDKKGKPVYTKKEVHRVQILDPATGTGTFLAEVVKQVAPHVRNQAPGLWATYVEKDLIPRLHGFELLMASYAMCHMKLDMVLHEYGYQPTASPPRVSVYLTNSLEEGEAANQTLPFAQWLSNEVKAANTIKRDMPIMVVIGNPPYSGISQNNSTWIENLISVYKLEPGGKKKLQERKHWINDDYVKFIRMAESLIEKNGQGVLGFITNHSYLDNPTFRGMRWHLLKSFDKIFILDLHGSTKRSGSAIESASDKNVFDIQQGVAIIIGVKKQVEPPSKTIRLASVLHADMWGDRAGKYDALWSGSVGSVQWKPVEPTKPFFIFSPRNWAGASDYYEGFALPDFMPVHSTGVITARDELAIDFEREELLQRMHSFCDVSRSDAEVRQQHFGNRTSRKYEPGDTRGWKLSNARKALRNLTLEQHVARYSYRLFDRRFVLYHPDLVDWPRPEVMSRVSEEGLSLVFCRQAVAAEWTHAFLSLGITDDSYLSNKSKERGYVAPLYLAPQADELDQTRRTNFEPKLLARLRKIAKHPIRGEPDDFAVFDYIYGALHCPAYRKSFVEFLKIDFPRIPWPLDAEVFWDVSDKGGQLRRLHLMESSVIGETPYPFTGEGHLGKGKVDKIEFRNSAVWINEHQRFENASEISWNFYIGGYQPAQKWLKDRKGRILDYADVQHYQRILKILSETDRIMQTIEMPLN